MSVALPRPCPICSRPMQAQTRPFCSRRCADVDLQRWFSGTYAIPGDEDGAEAGDEAGQGRAPLL